MNKEVVDDPPLSVFEQRRRVRRLRMIVELTCNLIRSDSSLTERQASSLIGCARKAILELSPEYTGRYDQTIQPRFDALMQERWPANHRCSISGELVN